MAIQSVGIVGAGQMGNGIAHVFALAGYDVLMTDISREALDKAVAAAAAGTEATIQMQARKGRASYLGERSIGHQDAGATSTLLLLTALPWAALVLVPLAAVVAATLGLRQARSAAPSDSSDAAAATPGSDTEAQRAS